MALAKEERANVIRYAMPAILKYLKESPLTSGAFLFSGADLDKLLAVAAKRNPDLDPEGCLAKAADDEPVFVTRAQDALAAELVERWAIQARAAGCGNDKVQEAKSIADEMLHWPIRKMPD